MEPFNTWLDKNKIPKNMIWKKPAEIQFHFVTEVLARLIAPTYEDWIDKTAFIVNEHRSKSIDLPVYLLKRNEISFFLRDNFFNWKLSVISKSPIEVDFTGLFRTTPPIDPNYTGNPLSSVYFEEFIDDWIFGYYEKSDKMKWSAEISRRLWPVYSCLSMPKINWTY